MAPAAAARPAFFRGALHGLAPSIEASGHLMGPTPGGQVAQAPCPLVRLRCPSCSCSCSVGARCAPGLGPPQASLTRGCRGIGQGGRAAVLLPGSGHGPGRVHGPVRGPGMGPRGHGHRPRARPGVCGPGWRAGFGLGACCTTGQGNKARAMAMCNAQWLADALGSQHTAPRCLNGGALNGP